MYNPRWPYFFTVIGESLDENGLPNTDENGDPTTESVSVEVVEYDGRWNPRMGADGKFKTYTTTVIPCNYRTSTGGIKDSGDVTVTDYKISCPMFITELPTGTILSMTDSVSTFRVRMIKMTTYNWGTNLWVDNIKN